MYRLYEKVPKSDEYEFGLKLLEQSDNPFKDGPCLISMIAIAMWEKDINGALNQGMEALRLKTSHNENSGIGLDNFQGRILSISRISRCRRFGAVDEPGFYLRSKCCSARRYLRHKARPQNSDKCRKL